LKKHLITTCKTILAMLAIFGLMLLSINPAAAATASSIRIVPNEGAPNSGYFVLNVAPTDTVIVDLYAVAPGTGVKTSIVQKAVTYDGPVDGLVLGYTFSELAVGTTVYACLVMNNVPDCSSTYVVPGTHTIPDTDKDGVADNIDLCSGTPPGTVVDATGCAIVVPPADADGDGVADDGTDKCLGTPAGTVVDATGCAIVVPPAASCPPGLGWKDANGNGKVDEGECHKRTGPIAGPPIATPPMTPPMAPPAEEIPPAVAVPAAPVATVPPAAAPLSVVPAEVVSAEVTPAVTEVDETNGRGATVETAAVETASSESGGITPEGRLTFGLIGLAILLAVTVWWVRPTTAE
jgi:hypothetical protein